MAIDYRDLSTLDLFTSTTSATNLSEQHMVTELQAEPVRIDWRRYMKLRPWVLQHDTDLSYLLLPEMQLLIESAVEETHRVLMATLWLTGARISEVLALTPSDILDDPDLGQVISLPTRKKRQTGGRPTTFKRRIEIHDHRYWTMLQRHLAAHRGGQHAPLFQSQQTKNGKKVIRPISQQSANNWISRAADNMRHQHQPGVTITCHTFRHSFAVNAVLHQVPIKTVSALLGHASVKETERYLQVLSIDVGHALAGVRFWYQG